VKESDLEVSQKLCIRDDLFGLILGQSAIEVAHLTRHMMKLRRNGQRDLHVVLLLNYLEKAYGVEQGLVHLGEILNTFQVTLDSTVIFFKPTPLCTCHNRFMEIM